MVQAVAVADAGYIATIGITPTDAAVGFGYIRTDEELVIEGAPQALRVGNFVEKPDLATARRYLSSGKYLWNAGMFIARADKLLEQLGLTEPELLAGILELAEAWDTPRRGMVVDRVWPTLKKIAIDYSIAEPAAAAGTLAVIPATSTGTTWATSRRSRSCTAPAEGANSPSSARTRACWPTRRAASWSPSPSG